MSVTERARTVAGLVSVAGTTALEPVEPAPFFAAAAAAGTVPVFDWASAFAWAPGFGSALGFGSAPALASIPRFASTPAFASTQPCVCSPRQSTRARNTNLGTGGCRNRLRCVRLRQFSAPSRSRRAAKELDSMIEQQPTVLSLSDAAALKLRELTKEETNPNIGLRVYVYSGGCSGFRYGMMHEDQPTPEDNVLEVNGTKVYVDGQSVSLLTGSEIDYVDTLMGAGFTVNNPNAVAACGCGSSFRTADDTGSPRGCTH